jgi:hypothetical protein
MCLYNVFVGLSLPMCEGDALLYDSLGGEIVNGRTAVCIQDGVYCCHIQLQSNIHSVAVQIFMTALLFTICSVYLPPHTPVTLRRLHDLLFDLSPSYLLLGDFSILNSVLGCSGCMGLTLS